MEKTDARWETKRRIPVSSRPADELLDWIESAPDELNRALNGEIPDAFGSNVKSASGIRPLLRNAKR